MKTSFKELYEAYMKLPKEMLAKLLAVNDIIAEEELKNKEKENNDIVIEEKEVEKKESEKLDGQKLFDPEKVVPSRLDTYEMTRCRTWKDCTNPHYDCVNCPLMYNTNYETSSGFFQTGSTPKRFG